MHLNKTGCGAGDRGEEERIFQVLRSRRLLARLPVDELCRLAADTAHISCATGGVVFRRGDAADNLFIIASGHVGIFLGDPGDYECLAGTACAGDLLGEAG